MAKIRYELDIQSFKPLEEGRPKLRYRKISPGMTRLFNRLVKPDQIVWAYPEEIPSSIIGQFLILDSFEVQKEVAKGHEIESPPIVHRVAPSKVVEKIPVFNSSNENLYELKETGESTDWYDVVNSATKKSINEKHLRRKDAEALRDTLNS